MNRPLDDLGPLYHSWRLFGVHNEQLPGIFALNQRCKEPILLAYIQLAIAKCRCGAAGEVSFAELFCADAYYAMAAAHFGATHSTGIDNNRDGYSSVVPAIATRLGLPVTLLTMDVQDIDSLPPFDVVANVGGLYHVSDPEEVLAKSFRLAKRFLIVQTVVSMATSDPEYRETPAPGLPHGCRFSRQSFERLIRAAGYCVRDSHFNELEGNARLEDRGSCYFLIEKP